MEVTEPESVERSLARFYPVTWPVGLRYGNRGFLLLAAVAAVE